MLLNIYWDSLKYIPKNSLRHRNIWSCTTNILVYSDEFSDIVYYLTDGTLVCVSAAVVNSPVYIADYHASLSSEYPVKYSTGKTSFFTRLEYQKKAVLNKDKIIIKAKKQ